MYICRETAGEGERARERAAGAETDGERASERERERQRAKERSERVPAVGNSASHSVTLALSAVCTVTVVCPSTGRLVFESVVAAITTTAPQRSKLFARERELERKRDATRICQICNGE